MNTGRQVPLIELLQKIPHDAVLQEHTPNPLGFNTAHHPVGALCHDAANRIAALEAELAERTRERDDVEKAYTFLADFRTKLGADFAAEREQREAWRATAQETYLLERDAARYRWLREAPPYSARWTRWRIEHWSGAWNPVQGSDMDAAIDAAIERAAGGEG